ncbi:MAG: T9SS type A sorting domain-containing protein [Bacteroidetes bacterium]|nr:T9SS type A sorting domain-containing protein [Bacteroidota bacterium]
MVNINEKNVNKVTVTDIYGKTMIELNGSNIKTANTTNLPNGVYMLKTVLANKETKIAKLIIQH